MKTLIVEQNDPKQDVLYKAAVAHLHAVYAGAFDASLKSAPPRFAVALTATGEIACAAGIRISCEGFMSQCYLDEPVEELLSRRTGITVTAASILEVGALATTSPFPVFAILRAITQWGRKRQMSWALFTGTTEVRRLISRARISALMLTGADRGRVQDPASWGSYYEHDPWVCAFHDDQHNTRATLPHLEMA